MRVLYTNGLPVNGSEPFSETPSSPVRSHLRKYVPTGMSPLMFCGSIVKTISSPGLYNSGFLSVVPFIQALSSGPANSSDAPMRDARAIAHFGVFVFMCLFS